VTCPDDNELTEFVAGVLGDASIARLEAHIDACEACRETLAALARCTLPLEPDTGTEPEEPEWMHDGLADGRYVPLHVVGAGGMSLVYEGFDTTLRRSVAIKVMLDAPAAAADRLAKEARALARLSHPNIVDVFDLEMRSGHAFLITELVDGGSLRAWLADAHRSTAEIVRVLVDAARGLAAAHDRGVVHRDVTPNNILVGGDGRARVADFGLGGLRPDPMEESAEVSETGELEGAGSRTAVGGTPGYIAPEVLAGKEIGPAADQFGLGVVGSETLSDASPSVARVLAKARAEDPEQRFASMEALATALEQAARPATRKPWVAVGAAALAIGAYAWWSESRTRAPCVDAPAPEVSTGSTVFDDDARTRVDSWVAVQKRLCAEDLGAERFDRRWECLRKYRDRIEAQAHHIDVSRVAVHLEALEALGDPSRCEDDERLERSVAVPPDALRADVEWLSAEMAAASVDYRFSQSQEARQRLDALEADAKALGYDPLTAEIMFLRGHAQRQAGETDAARATFADAAHRASSSGLDEIAARAWLGLVFVAGHEAMDLEGALDALRFADSLLQRIGEPASLMGYRAETLGVIYSRRGDHQQAQPYLEEAVVQLRRAHGDDSLLVADALTDLGINEARMGELEATRKRFAEARRIVAARLGDDAAKLGEMLGNAAALEFAFGNMPAAADLARQALERLEPAFASDDSRLATIHGTLGQALYFDRKTPEALPHLQAAYEGRAARHPAEHPAVLEARYQLAMAYRNFERWQDAEALLTHAETQAQGDGVPEHLRGLLLYELGAQALNRNESAEGIRLCTLARGHLAAAGADSAAANAQHCIDSAE